MFNRKVTRQLIFFGGLATVVLYALVAFAQGSPDPFGGDTAYREAVDPDGPFSWLSPRVIIWVLAQLHLLFAAFVLAVPMFVLLIEVVGIRTKDPVESKKYDDLAHEFAKLMTTAFSITSILGAIFTFACMGMYPKLFNYLAEVFGPSMYLYSCIFFGESFSLYFYYYGWGKMKSRWAHVGVGVLLNFFGICHAC